MIPFWRRKNGKIKDASRWKRPGAYFNADLANTKVEFIESSCRHSKGELAGQLFKLSAWQREIVRGIFGWTRLDDGTRLYREVYIEVPKKNGKSTFAAALADTILLTEAEAGAEIYSVAAETEQANIIFSVAKEMIRQDEELRSVTEIFRRSIIYKTSTYQVLSADADTKEGRNAHAVLFDELHVQPDRELYDNLKTGMASRRQPLMVMLTTAGYDRNSICWEKHQKAMGTMNGTIDDPAFLGIVFAADPEDDWTSPKVWRKANPNLGISVKLQFLKEQCAEAQRSPASENTFKRKHLNIWTEQESRWLQMAEWDGCAQPPVIYEELKGRTCYGGLDLASTTDIAALVLVFPPRNANIDGFEDIRGYLNECPKCHDQQKLGLLFCSICGGSMANAKSKEAVIGHLPHISGHEPFFVLPFFWIPEENLHDRVKRDGVPYDVWARQEFIKTTPGNLIDYRWIMLTLGQCRIDFDLRVLAFDRWGSQKIVNDLCDEVGFTVDPKESQNYRKPLLIQFGQGFASMSPPTKELLNLILGRKISHGGNPVLRWMAGNMIVKQDPAGNVKPDKGKSTEKIDGMVAMVMGLGVALANPGPTMSIYEQRARAGNGSIVMRV